MLDRNIKNKDKTQRWMTKRLKAASQLDRTLCSFSRTEPLLRPGTHYEKERPGSNEEAPFKLTRVQWFLPAFPREPRVTNAVSAHRAQKPPRRSLGTWRVRRHHTQRLEASSRAPVTEVMPNKQTPTPGPAHSSVIWIWTPHCGHFTFPGFVTETHNLCNYWITCSLSPARVEQFNYDLLKLSFLFSK